MKNIVVCGDSFSIGIGCPNIKEEPYGSLLAKELDANLLNFAKGSSSNFSILLQVKYAIENVKDIDFLCVGMTCNYRTEWFKDDYDFDNEIKNTDVNYHEYPPYCKDTNNVLLDKHPMQDDPNYKGGMFTENYMGIVNYYESVIKKKEKFGNYFSKFDSESPEKMKILYDYYFNFFNIKIQQQYDLGIIVMIHLLLNKNNIKHFILNNDDELKNYIDDKFLLNVDWLGLAKDYPDEFGYLHTSPEGHKIVYNRILKKMKLIYE